MRVIMSSAAIIACHIVYSNFIIQMRLPFDEFHTHVIELDLDDVASSQSAFVLQNSRCMS